MYPATKSIAWAPDNLRENVALDFTNAGDATRQEFKQEADVNWILHRFNVTGAVPPQRTPIWGERDFDIDLHTGYLAIADAQRGFNRLPLTLRQEYGNYMGLLDAVHKGTFKQDLQTAIDDVAREQEEAAATREASPPQPPTPE